MTPPAYSAAPVAVAGPDSTTHTSAMVARTTSKIPARVVIAAVVCLAVALGGLRWLLFR
jgi:hypothetical protein